MEYRLVSLEEYWARVILKFFIFCFVSFVLLLTFACCYFDGFAMIIYFYTKVISPSSQYLPEFLRTSTTGTLFKVLLFAIGLGLVWLYGKLIFDILLRNKIMRVIMIFYHGFWAFAGCYLIIYPLLPQGIEFTTVESTNVLIWKVIVGILVVLITLVRTFRDYCFAFLFHLFMLRKQEAELVD